MLLVNCALVLIYTDTFHNILALKDETTTGKHILKWCLLQPSKLYKHKLVWRFVHTEASADVQVKTGKDQNNILHVVVRMAKLQVANGYLCLHDVYHRENYVQRIIHSKTGRMSQRVCHTLDKMKGTLMVSQSHTRKVPQGKRFLS